MVIIILQAKYSVIYQMYHAKVLHALLCQIPSLYIMAIMSHFIQHIPSQFVCEFLVCYVFDVTMCLYRLDKRLMRKTWCCYRTRPSLRPWRPCQGQRPLDCEALLPLRGLRRSCPGCHAPWRAAITSGQGKAANRYTGAQKPQEKLVYNLDIG